MIETALYLVLFAATLVAGTLGLVVVFQAYRGYRRNDSKPMLLLAIGFALLTLGPFGLSLAVTAIARAVGQSELVVGYLLPLASRILEIAGLSVILYSLYDRKR
jgi:hypothetical protein